MVKVAAALAAAIAVKGDDICVVDPWHKGAHETQGISDNEWIHCTGNSQG